MTIATNDEGEMTLDDVRFDAVPRRSSQPYSESSGLLDVIEERPDWQQDAGCLGFTTWFSGAYPMRETRRKKDKAAIERRLATCRRCPVRSQCAAMYLDDESGQDLPLGVIAGLLVPPEMDKDGRRETVVFLRLIAALREDQYT